MGDVNLYGHEQPPTLTERQATRNEHEVHTCTCSIGLVERYISTIDRRGMTTMNTMNAAIEITDPSRITEMTDVIYLVTLRIKELSEVKVKKQMAPRSLKKKHCR